jgi:manganese/zinc/iron transport system substrate-binding protein
MRSVLLSLVFGFPALLLAQPVVVTSVGMAADTVAQIAGDAVKVQSLMGPGTDPHLYRATAGDLRKLRSADLIVSVGLHLEGKMQQALSMRGKKRVILGEHMPVAQLISGGTPDLYDPHVWFDPELWTQAASSLVPALSELVPGQSATFQANYESWRSRVLARAAELKKEIALIPRERRVLVTSHDAFQYLGRYFDIQVEGLQGISTESEAGLKRMKDLIDLVKARQVGALFVESSVPPAGIERLKQSTGVGIGGELYSDALGPADSPAGSYLGMLETNLATIRDGLKRK